MIGLFDDLMSKYEATLATPANRKRRRAQAALLRRARRRALRAVRRQTKVAKPMPVPKPTITSPGGAVPAWLQKVET